MTTLVCLLEEPSAKEMLLGVLPRLLPEGIDINYIVFEGKQDLDNNLVKRLRFWQRPNSFFLIMRDKDAGNCKSVKANILEKVRIAGKQTHSIVRIACHELETFYLGDLEAVERGLQITGLKQHQEARNYRDPDSVSNPVEILKRSTHLKYQKIAGSRAISSHLKLDGSNRSSSFNALILGLRKLMSI